MMKKIILVYALSFLSVLIPYHTGRSSEFGEKGFIAVNNNVLGIKDSAAYWDTENRLLIFFYPFKLNKEDIERMKLGYSADFVAPTNRPSPDPAKWKYCPFGMLEISFTRSRKEKKWEDIHGIILAFVGFKPKYLTININRYGKEVKDFLKLLEIGKDTAHDFVNVFTEGKDKIFNDKCSWELKTRARIFSAGR